MWFGLCQPVWPHLLPLSPLPPLIQHARLILVLWLCQGLLFSGPCSCCYLFTYFWPSSPYPSCNLWLVNTCSFLKSQLKMSLPEMPFLTLPSKFRPLSFCLRALSSVLSQLLSQFQQCISVFLCIASVFQLDQKLHADRVFSTLSGTKYIILPREMYQFSFLRWLGNILDFWGSLVSFLVNWHLGRFLQSYFEIQQPQQIFESKSHEWIICPPASVSSEILSCSDGVKEISR